MFGGLQGASIFSSVLVQNNLPEGDCIAHAFFFSPSMVMVRRTSTGKTLQRGTSGLTLNPRGPQREVFYFLLLACFTCGLCLAPEEYSGLRGPLERDVPLQ